MKNSRIFLALVTLQLCIPVAVYLLVGLHNGRESSLDYLPQNYLFMAAPHLLILLFSIHPSFSVDTHLAQCVIDRFSTLGGYSGIRP
ncbi:MAG: hypothetical protein ACKOF9_05310 [Burkholderiales bacterium]